MEKLHTHPPSTVALSYHAPSVAKRMETTAEDLKVLIDKFDCIVS
ncbi:MAG TPA: hypothetical protein VLQ93_11115 [Myxococcaceae bacterium]|nr:hypothetical protein [Myxococcaceae bacterium]